MGKEQNVNTLSQDGLRYKSRDGGTPFQTGGTGVGTRSCYMCGKRQKITNGKTRLMIGKHQFVCFGCKPEKVVKQEPTA